MRRWNGWGDSLQTVPLPPHGLALLQSELGPGERSPDATIQAALAGIPAPGIPPQPGISTEAEARLRHARGQSLPDWVALRSGRIGRVPDGVAFPESEEDLRSLLDLADRHGWSVIPYGGGTSVVGHINPLSGDRPVATVDLGRLDRLIDLDPVSRLATFQAGVSGPALEAALAPHGLTLGHFPQSFEYSTLGGWIATRSTGQQSLGFGRIEDLLAGAHLETPVGPLDLPPYPASAAGPDLRQLVLGSEGRMGFLTRATMRVRPRPPSERFLARVFRSWEEGTVALRRAVQQGTGASMLRLSDPVETETTLHLAGRPGLARALTAALRTLGYGPGFCLLIMCVDGRQPGSRLSGGIPLGSPIGQLWKRSRFRAPYLRNSLWDAGYALDTLETALPWSGVLACSRAVLEALRTSLDSEAERVLAFAHLSHVYPDGASLYVTFLFRRSPDPDRTLDRWRRLKAAATETLLAHGGTLSHQHGVGLDHLPYLEREKGPVGMAALGAALRALDPHGIMNPGKLIPQEASP